MQIKLEIFHDHTILASSDFIQLAQISKVAQSSIKLSNCIENEEL